VRAATKLAELRMRALERTQLQVAQRTVEAGRASAWLETAERIPEGQGNLSGGWSAPLLRVALAATEAAQWKANTSLVDAAQASARLRRCVSKKHGLS